MRVKEVRAGRLRLTRWNGCAICLRKYLATWTPSSTVRLRLASVRCSWIQRGSFPRLSARANRWVGEEGKVSGTWVGGWAWATCPTWPPWKVTRGTASLAGPLNPHLVSKDHEAIVRLAPDGPTHTLGRVAHGIKGEKVVLSDLELVPQVLQPCLWVWTGGMVPFCPSFHVQPLPHTT